KSMYLDPSDSAYANLFNSGRIGMLVTGPWDLGVGTARVTAAEKFLRWLTAPAQVKYFSLRTGDLPTRQSVKDGAGFSTQMNASLPGVQDFITNLGNVKQVRPQLASYPKISQVLGTMVVSVLLGKAQPQAALSTAAQQVDQLLAAG
ncbi:MAG: ABC transporter substrate-binding protein, partial [Actinomycetota bacterium]